MVGFLIKKTFFDIWDNFLAVFLSNLVFIMTILGFMIVQQTDLCSTIGNCAVCSAVFALVFCLLYLGSSGMAFEWSNYRRTWKDGLKKAYSGHFFHCLFFFLILFCFFFYVVFLLPFYLNSGSYIGIGIAVMMFWMFLVVLPAMQFYFPLSLFMPEDGSLLTFKKSLALLFNNKAFTLFVSLKTVFDFALSICTCFIIPGFSGLALSHTDAVKLLLIRHDYMREHGITKSDINIYTLLEEENEKVGKRNLRSMIFPWKN